MPRTPSFPVPLTAEHLRKGNSQACYDCPLALALYDATGEAWHVMGHQATIELDTGQNLPWRLPPPIRALIAAIDAGEHVAPQVLQLPGRFREYVRKTST